MLATVMAALGACNREGGGAATGAAAAKKGAGKKGDIAVPVAIAKVSTRDVPVDVEVIGNVEPYSTVSVKARVTGPIERVNFHEGDFVKKGDKLFTIDRIPFENAVAQAVANLERDKAQLLQARANLQRDLAQQKFLAAQAGRFANLQKEGVISKEQAEQYQSNADVSAQSIAATRAAITSAEASAQATEATLKTARIQLGYTEVVSPIEGRTGPIPMKEGNLTTANVTELVSISQVQPVYVGFGVPEAQLGIVKSAMTRGRLPVTASPPDDPQHPETGTLTFVDSSVDTSTGTIKLKATFANAARKLWPGQFVRVRLRLGVRPNAAVVPNQAVQTGQDGPYVYRVKPDNTAEMAKVTTAGRVDQDMVIESGLEPGDTIVSEGQLRLAPGMRIRLRGEGGKGGGMKKAVGGAPTGKKDSGGGAAGH